MTVRIITADVLAGLAQLPDESVHCVVTSPPYWGLRSYNAGPSEIGLEPTLAEHIERLVGVFEQVRRVLRPDGVCFLNYGDAYATQGGRGEARMHELGRPSLAAKTVAQARGAAPGTKVPDGLKPKDLCLIPHRLAIALQDRGWWVRDGIVWHKPGPMPSSATDRCTQSYEMVYMLTKRARYFWDAEAIKEPTSDGTGTRNKRNVWTIPTYPFNGWIDSYDLVPLSTSEVQELVASDNGCDDGTARITSLDCPLHADLPDLVPTGFCDGPLADQWNRIRDKHARRDEGTLGDCDAIGRTLDQSPSLPSKSGCLDHEGFQTATSHSTQTRKMDRGLSSSEHAKFSGQIASSTGHTEPPLSALVSISHGTDESKTEACNCPSRSGRQIPGDSAHKRGSGDSSGPCDSPVCSCRYYQKVVKKQSHFATFPPKLVETCLKAGCPEKVCADCGAPYVREVERTPMEVREGPGRQGLKDAAVNGTQRTACTGTMTKPPTTKTLGFSPSCDCQAGTVAGTCLDPFGGSGTTGLVADRMKRNAVLIELSPEYAEMARRRIEGDAGLFAQVDLQAEATA